MAEGGVEHWKRLAEQYKKSWETTQEELNEFQTQSKELEKELELELEQSEKRGREMQGRIQKLEGERDSLTMRLEDIQRESMSQMERLNKELMRISVEMRSAQITIRNLEQTNDDLERANRNVTALLEDFERRQNEMLERNALLESELDEKEVLKDCIQRWKEENRDLRQEISARQLRQQHSYTSPSVSNGTTSSTTPIIINGSVSSERVPISPTTGRVSALNIVGDLLRKVGVRGFFLLINIKTETGHSLKQAALESKLASCRKVPSSDQQPVEAPQAKQAHLA